MAKSNGTLTEKQVSTWFEGLSFDRQVSLLDSLSISHSKIRNARIAELRRELAALDGGNGHANGVAKARQAIEGAGEISRPSNGRHLVGTWPHVILAGGEGEGRR